MCWSPNLVLSIAKSLIEINLVFHFDGIHTVSFAGIFVGFGHEMTFYKQTLMPLVNAKYEEIFRMNLPNGTPWWTE